MPRIATRIIGAIAATAFVVATASLYVRGAEPATPSPQNAGKPAVRYEWTGTIRIRHTYFWEIGDGFRRAKWTGDYRVRLVEKSFGPNHSGAWDLVPLELAYTIHADDVNESDMGGLNESYRYVQGTAEGQLRGDQLDRGAPQARRVTAQVLWNGIPPDPPRTTATQTTPAIPNRGPLDFLSDVMAHQGYDQQIPWSVNLAFDNVGNAYSDEEETALYKGINVTEHPDLVHHLLCHHVPMPLRYAPYVFGLLEKRDETEICGSKILRSDVAGASETVIVWDFERKPISKSIGKG